MNDITVQNNQLIEQISLLKTVPKESLIENSNQAAGKESSFREQLMKNGIVKDEDYQKALASITGLEFVEFIEPLSADLQEEFTTKIPIRFVKKHLFYPYRISETELVFAVLDSWLEYEVHASPMIF